MNIELNSEKFNQKNIFEFAGLLENMQLRDILTIQRLVSLEINRQVLMIEYLINNEVKTDER